MSAILSFDALKDQVANGAVDTVLVCAVECRAA